MIGCLRIRVRKQPIITLYFEFETVLKFNNPETLLCGLITRNLTSGVDKSGFLASNQIPSWR